MKKKVIWPLGLVLVLVAAFAYIMTLPDQQAWDSFVRVNQAANEGDWQQVYDDLSQETRQQFEQVGDMIRQYAQILDIPESALGSTESMFVAAMPQLDEMQTSFYKGAYEVTDATRHGDTAAVEVLNRQSGQTQTVNMVREQGVWKLVVPLQDMD